MNKTAFYYTIGDYRILIENPLRAEVLPHTTLSSIPFAPAWCAGLGSIRGDICLAINMHYLLSQASITKQPVLLYLQTPNFSPTILCCETLPKTMTHTNEAVQRERPTTLPGWIHSVWQDAQGLILGLNHERLFYLLNQPH